MPTSVLLVLNIQLGGARTTVTLSVAAALRVQSVLLNCSYRSVGVVLGKVFPVIDSSKVASSVLAEHRGCRTRCHRLLESSYLGPILPTSMSTAISISLSFLPFNVYLRRIDVRF
jgi:hypothetical protein